MKTAKDRKNSGRKITKIYHPELYPYEETTWDNWDDARDGYRQLGRDKTKITPISTVQKNYKYRAYKCTDIQEVNQKNKRQLRIRQQRKHSRNDFSREHNKSA